MKPTASDELRNYYAARATEYDDDRRYPPERAADISYLRSTIPCQFTGRRVIDVACGTGSWTGLISRYATNVVGVDVNQSVLDIARRRPALESTNLTASDAYCLGKELGTFNAAFVGFWISHVPRSRLFEFLASLHRRLEPGAMVMMVDNSEALCKTIPISDRDAEGNTFQSRKLADGSSFRILKNFLTASELTTYTAPFGVNAHFRELEHFWILMYESAAPKVAT
jgi:demethylmenaquinone methyltransferase/2-methoxy-6-polyprenyl-1,4-benzoquinol methylase